MPIDRELYLSSWPDPPEVGEGQELILFEILGCLQGMRTIWLPFISSLVLPRTLDEKGFDVISLPYHYVDPFNLGGDPPLADAVYFGTPTIVNNRPLFPGAIPGIWTKEKERQRVRKIVSLVTKVGYRKIVCGLGSGDISLNERLLDLGGGGRVVCFKDFGTFQDWVIEKEL